MFGSKRLSATIALSATVLLIAMTGSALAFSSLKTTFNNTYGTAGSKLDSCNTCHTSGYGFNTYGQDLKNNNNNYGAIEGLDSDGDGYTNKDEITARTFPGDAGDKPAVVGPVCTDNDGDGFAVEGGDCGPADCNDNDQMVNPEAVENCTDGIDNNCNGLIDTTDPAAQSCPPVCTDADKDGYAVEGGACGPIDCNDNNASVNPNAVENCTDNLDNNCDGLVDAADANAVDCPIVVPPTPVCTDADGDGYAVEGGTCGPTDCDDLDPLVNPGASELCTDGIDNDCNGLIDTADPEAVACPVPCTDEDQDGYAVDGGLCGPVDCNDQDPAINPGAAENCSDAVDNNCNDKIDAADPSAVDCPLVCTDADKDGFAIEGGECGPIDPNDTDASVYPGSVTPEPTPTPEPATADGQAVFDNNCAGCHTLTGTSKMNLAGDGAKVASAHRTGSLSSAEKTALAAYLNDQSAPEPTPTPEPTPAPAPTDGVQLYADNCAMCHGELTASDVRGASAPAIASAVAGDAGGMGFLSSLGAEEVQAIAEALAGSIEPPVVTDPDSGDDHDEDNDGGQDQPDRKIFKQVEKLERMKVRSQERLARAELKLEEFKQRLADRTAAGRNTSGAEKGIARLEARIQNEQSQLDAISQKLLELQNL